MMKNRIKICWLLLLTLLYTQCFALSVSPAYAHYDTTVVASTLLEVKPHGMTSDCMIQKGDPSMTVLVGSLEKSRKVSFWLKSSGSDAVGDLLWSVSNPDHLQYVQIAMQIDSVTIDPGETIELLRDVPMTFTMTISPTAIAKTTEHPEMKIHVVVTWGDEMWGTFQVILPEVKAETETSENEDPEHISQEENDLNQPEDGTGISSSTSAPEDPSQQTAEPPETTEPETEPTETTEPETEPTETTEPETEPTETTEPVTEPTEPTIPAPTVTPEEPEEEEEETDTDAIWLETLTRFDLSQALPVKMHASEKITSVRLGLQVEEEEETRFEPFPDYTMFSLNQGESYYMMHDGYIAEFALGDASSVPVLLDFSRTDLQTDEALVLAMEGYRGNDLVEVCTVQTTPDAQESCFSLVHPLNAETNAVMFAEGDTREAAASTKAFGWPSRALSQNSALEFTLPMEWLDAELEYSVEMLTMTEEQTLAYVPVTLSRTGLYGTYMDYDLTHNLVFRVGENLVPAGTYRLNMKWSYKGICFAKTQTTFFINYPADTAQMLGG